MKTQPPGYYHLVLRKLRAAGILDRIAYSDAVVLERLPRAAGATNWYYCRSRADLELVAKKITPGGLVSFYFDERISRGLMSPKLMARVRRMLADTGEVLIGGIGQDGVSLEMVVVVGNSELAELEEQLLDHESVFYGVFPGTDNDGTAAITCILPDADGVVRKHPH